MAAYYNEIDPQAAAWLRELIKQGEIADGEVDTRSIEDVAPADLAGFRQCHFFAGIGGWSLALRLAGWPDDREIWTGSCPCQPFSSAGQGAGFADERHLWPAFQWLIQQRRPAVVAGEQVASRDADPWLDLVHADLEGMGYAFGGIAFPAAGIGAPHIRDRLYWLGHADEPRLEGLGGGHQAARGRLAAVGSAATASEPVRLADANGRDACAEWQQRSGQQRQQPQDGGGLVGVGHADGDGAWRLGGAVRGSQAGQGGRGRGDDAHSSGATDRPGPVNGHWATADWLGCRDGKWRPVEPGTFPLAHGLPARVGRLRGYGNAIVPQAAAEFIKAYTGGL